MSVLVGRKAPNFTAAAVSAKGDIIEAYDFYKAIEGKHALVFFYPLDFTFVCPSELIALDRRIETFKELNVEVVGVSIDSQFTHHAWRNTPMDKGGIGPVQYTLVADVNHAIAQAYGVEHPVAGVAFRGAFIIDKNQTVRAQLVNDLPLGRSIEELVRLVEALQFHEKHGEVCPANWQQGKKTIKATPEGIQEYLSSYNGEL